MNLILIASAVDHGTRTISSAFASSLKPDSTVTMKQDVRGLSFRDWLGLRSEIRVSAKSANVVLCLNHGAVLAGGLLLRHQKQRRLVGIFDWSRQFPSRRKDFKTRLYAWLLRRALRRFSAVCSPVTGMREFYAPSILMQPILYPLPYPDVDMDTHGLSEEGITNVLFIGADIKRKGGDILLREWQKRAPDTARLSFVSPSTPDGKFHNVVFLHDIKPFTQSHRKLLETHTIFILPSHREAYGYAALEALNFGHVVVTTANAGIAELVVEAGGMVGESPEDAVRLAMELLQQPAEIARRRAECRSFMAGYQQRFHELMQGALVGSPPA